MKVNYLHSKPVWLCLCHTGPLGFYPLSMCLDCGRDSQLFTIVCSSLLQWSRSWAGQGWLSQELALTYELCHVRTGHKIAFYQGLFIDLNQGVRKRGGWLICCCCFFFLGGGYTGLFPRLTCQPPMNNICTNGITFILHVIQMKSFAVIGHQSSLWNEWH